ncbi:hypothetical protein [Oceanobacillus jeddahense]|uniref:Fur-regulated basic protein FbpA n=1 Tax=Oceanobacillus jeddahense TaxID=1462527 RepID=A0ABY5JPY0_9BACI|nr:hypothetical protein [Oceanobacillus jeddahense]UUI02161.1 hypothetical protein NP439_19280 [Oceanobacillus jeddahense]
MGREQEQYQKILKRVIHDTENQKVNSMDEIIQLLIKELSLNTNIKRSY